MVRKMTTPTNQPLAQQVASLTPEMHWAIRVASWGTLYAIGTEAQAEEWRWCKANWEGSIASKREATPDEVKTKVFKQLRPLMKTKNIEPIQFVAIASILLLTAIGIWGLLLAPPEAVGFKESGDEPLIAMIITLLGAWFAIQVIFTEKD